MSKEQAPEPLPTPVGAGETAGESKLTVLLALAANIGVGLLKLAAGVISGSVALLSEAAHSAGDSTTELFLLVAQKRSLKPADRTHPFGYGKERYFWSLLAAVSIFASGAMFALYEGVSTVLGHGEAQDRRLDQAEPGYVQAQPGPERVRHRALRVPGHEHVTRVVEQGRVGVAQPRHVVAAVSCALA